MAKKTIEFKKETFEKKDSKGNDKVVETTKKAVVDNLDAAKIKAEEKILEKEEKRLDNIEKTAHAAKEENEKLIAEKKAQLIALEPKPESKELKVVEVKKEEKKTEKKTGNRANPFSAIRYLGAKTLSWGLGMPSRVVAKVNHIISKPQQVASGGFRKDLGKNAINALPSVLTTLTGAFYKPHREKFKMVNNFKDYGETFGPGATKGKLVKNILWGAGKVATPTLTPGVWSGMTKFFSNISRGLNHLWHETAEGIEHSKRHWNPKKRNLKPWRYAKAINAFKKAFSLNSVGEPVGINEGTIKTSKVFDLSPKKEITIVKEEKKAA